jgi:hypothetical protein
MHRRASLLVPLLAACSVGGDGGGDDPTPVTPLTEGDVEGFVTDEAIDLAPGSSMGGSRLATEEDLANIDWGDLVGVPADLLDGDDDTLGVLACAEGEWPTVVGGVWSCTGTLPLSRIEAGAAAEGDVLMMTASGPAWVSADTLLAGLGCPSGMVRVGDGCVESAVRGPTDWMDAVSACAASGAHLCFHAELAPACLTEAVGPATNPSGLEWTSDRTANGQAAVAFSLLYDCDATADNVGSSREFRCCTAAR